MSTDDLLFAAEDAPGTTVAPAPGAAGSWKVMVVDDEKEVHSITKIALGDFVFEGKSIEFVHAYSAREAKEQMAKHPDTALMLLDVVMEEEDAGLQVVKFIREKLLNNMVRIILRTGQPGQAPERKVIIEYDINDYKTKTELTSQKLFTTTVAAVRAFRDIKIIDNNKKGLEKIIDASSSIFELKSLEKFIAGALTQLTALLHMDDSAAFVKSFAACEKNGELYILAGTGSFAAHSNKMVKEAVPMEILEDLVATMAKGKTEYFEDHGIIYFKTKNGTPNMIYMHGTKQLTAWDKNLLEIFCGNIAVALDNIYLIDRIVLKELESERHRRDKEKASEALSRYVSPHVANEIMTKDISLQSERKTATVFFFDIRNFTSMSETLRAEEVVSFLNDLFTDIVDIIFEYNGTLDKFLGDGLMAVFGVPLTTGNDAMNAVKAALKIRETVAKLNSVRAANKLPPIKFGIGIHTGEVVAGNVGSRKRIDYTIIGRNVNLASRVEALNKHFDTDILITEATHEQVKDAAVCWPHEAMAVKGVQQPVTTFRIDSLRSSVN